MQDHHKNQSSEIDTSPQPPKIDSPSHPSELTEQLYSPIMDKMNGLPLQIILAKLDKSGIIYDNTQFYHTFCKSCVKTDWESTLYEIKFGYFRVHLKLITVQLHSNSLCNNSVASGGFGQVLKFHLANKEQYALKDIKCDHNNSQQVNMALQQISMAKFFSALETGPKFHQIFSYDAIIFTNCVQFAMEFCRTDYQQQQIDEEIQKQGLLNLLKIIHSLGICHLDIKKRNIAWSCEFGKFVFMDFTFTRFVQQPIGYKQYIADVSSNLYITLLEKFGIEENCLSLIGDC